MSSSNYNQKNNFDKINVKKISISEIEDQLKIDLKNVLGLNRTPRNLNIFANFYKAYQLQKMINQNTENNIHDINIDAIFISTKRLQQSFGLKSDDYKIYFEKLITEWEDTTYEYNGKNAKCRIIKSFSPQFIELCEKYSNLKFNREFYQKYYYQIKDFSDEQINQLRSIFKNLKKEEREKTEGISRTLISQSEFDNMMTEDFYHSTEDSPFRIYHQLQTITKSVKSKMFNGYYDIDLQQCFASIAWNLLDMKNCSLAYAWLLNPELKHDLRQKIKDDFGLDNIDLAKQKVCALFTEKYTSGEKNVEWYNQLHLEIMKRVKTQLGKLVEWNGQTQVIDTFHKFFTYHEQMIISKLSQECNVVLNMHDGIIATNKPQHDYVEYLGFKFLLSINQFVDIQFIKDENFIQQQKTLNQMQQIGNISLELNKEYKNIELKNSLYDTPEQPDLIWGHLL